MSFKKRIFFRIFPAEKNDFDNLKMDISCNKIYVRHLQELSRTCAKATPSYWEFETNGIFFNSTQEEIYNEVTEDILKNIINGCNGVILAFGQTGSGKSFSTSGLHLTEQDFGILPRIAKDLFKLRKQEPANIKLSFQMSYVEFYNTYAVDLLSSRPDLLELSKCRGVRRIHLLNELDALKYIFIGEGRKNFVEQNCRYSSNLSTSVATYHIIKKNMDLTNPTKICSRLHIIDMAGNESGTPKASICKNVKQIGLANITKSQLEQFILCLTENIPERIKVKQRTNALIYYLNGDFSHESILRFIGHIKAKSEDLTVTLSMLRFGNLMQNLKMKRKVIHFSVNEEVELDYLRTRLKSMEKEKYLDSILLNQNLVGCMNQARRNHLKNLVNEYLSDGIREITVMNVADVDTVLQHIKMICQEHQEQIKKLRVDNQLMLAQQHSDISLKLKVSKTNSQGSGNKLSRKSSKARSKESITKEKRASGSIVSEKRIKTSNNDIHAAEVSSISQKRKKSVKSYSSALNKYSTQSKRKSSNTSVDKRDSKSSIKSSPEFSIPIPEVVPEKRDMWIQFTSSSNYKERVEEYKQNERDIQNNFISYVGGIKKLRNCRDTLDKCNSDLLQAQTFRHFHSKDEYDENGVLVLSFAEKECRKHLDAAQKSLIGQQEKVLTSQEVLKVYLDNRRSITRRAEREFDQYCTDKFVLPSIDIEFVENDLNSYTFDINLEQPDDILGDQKEITFIPHTSKATQIIHNLKKLMLVERKRRNRILKEKKNEWKQI